MTISTTTMMMRRTMTTKSDDRKGCVEIHGLSVFAHVIKEVNRNEDGNAYATPNGGA